MTISIKNAGTYIDLTSSSSLGVPGSPADGDRMFLFVSNKDYSNTINVSAGWTAIGSQYADGTDGAGNGDGSVAIHAWYRDWQSGDTGATVTVTSDGGAAIIQLWTKDSEETWDTPLTTNAAWPGSASQTVSAVATLDVPDGSVVIGHIGFSDNITTITRATTDIDVASGITWNGDYVEAPTTHFSSSSALDAAADLGHRFVTTGGTVTLRLSATLSTSETGSVKFIVQGVTGASPPSGSSRYNVLSGEGAGVYHKIIGVT